MIELKNVCKTYKAKKGTNTTALDNVSVTFDNKGMTFILGKSGSGKSTMLNILGGLDSYDSGDMIILGKSSKDFSQKDFDSYRNTYVGFIFQEFNLLEEYDVYQNIILALQLQQKEINEKEIDDLLDKLELTNLKNRKINELSGGQKQRVAIARALIKNPKIILADEPTGNLDSDTGNQVMDLLKSISKEKLVIMVSHDEDYAKKYADRIIEVKDGKIINDTNKKKIETLESNYETVVSKLPFKDSFKLGAGSLNHKKLRLTITIFLVIITLGFFSCTDTLSSLNFNKAHTKYLTEKNEEFIEISSQDVYEVDKNLRFVSTELKQEDAKEVRNKMNSNGFEVYNFNMENRWDQGVYNIMHIKEDYENLNSVGNDGNISFVVADNISDVLKESLTGKNPEGTNDVVISNYIADMLIRNGVEVYEKVAKDEFESEHYYKPDSYEDIINSNYTFYLGEDKVKIVGVINYDLSNINANYISNVLFKIFVNKEFINARKDIKYSNLKSYIAPMLKFSDEENDSFDYNVAVLDHEIEYFDGKSWVKTNSLKENEVILPLDTITNKDSKYYDNFNNYMKKPFDNYELAEKKFITNYIQKIKIIGSNADLELRYLDNEDGNAFKNIKDIKVVGVYYRESSEDDSSQSYIYFSKDLLGEYTKSELELNSILYPIKSKNQLAKINKMFPIDSKLAIKSTYSGSIYTEISMIKSIKKITLYAGIIFLVFTVFLISNFMVLSVNYRKKEIGTLRALGSSGLDIMNIFLWEAFTLCIISGTVASILLVIVSNKMNRLLLNSTGILTSPFIVGVRQFFVIFLVVFVVTYASSIIPIIKISKKKPIDAILNK